jgi:transposase
MKAYPSIFRQKIIEAYQVNPNKAQIAANFGVSLSSVKRYLKMEQTTGQFEPKPNPGRKVAIKPEQYPELEQLIQANPSATLEELSIKWGETHPNTPTTGTFSRTLKRMQWSYKKKVKSRRTQ